MSSTHHSIRPYARLLITLVVLALVPLGLILYAQFHLKHESLSNIVERIQAEGYPTSFEELNEWHTWPVGENALAVYIEAYYLLPELSPDKTENVPFIGYQSESFHVGQRFDDEMLGHTRMVIEHITPALDKAKYAATLAESRSPFSYTDSMNEHEESSMLPMQLRQLARNLMLAAAVALHDNQPGEAIQYIDCIFHLSEQYGKEPDVISLLTSIALHNMGYASLISAWHHTALPVSDLKRIDSRLEKYNPFTALSSSCIGERVFLLDQDPEYKLAYQLYGCMYDYSIRDDFEFYERLITLAKTPPSSFSVLLDTDRDMLPHLQDTETIPMLSAIQFLSPLLENMYIETARIHMIRTAIALENYHFAHGHLPEKLDDLVPDFLTDVLSDPADGEPLRYRRLTNGYVVYSVGRDLKDDGGLYYEEYDLKNKGWHEYDLTLSVERPGLCDRENNI